MTYQAKVISVIIFIVLLAISIMVIPDTLKAYKLINGKVLSCEVSKHSTITHKDYMIETDDGPIKMEIYHHSHIPYESDEYTVVFTTTKKGSIYINFRNVYWYDNELIEKYK